jgi:hypothetical protein
VCVVATGCGKRGDSGAPPKADDEQKTARRLDAGRGDEPKASEGRFENGFFVAEGAPAPQSCTSADDCNGDTVLDASGCCNEPTQIVPHSKAYAAWSNGWRQEHCADHQCPPPPNPAEPDECLFTVDCVDGHCVNRCAD